MSVFLEEIHLQNFLSFGPEAKPVKLGKLNILIGPNGSGKSNLLEAIGILSKAPTDMAAEIRKGGHVRDLVNKDNDGIFFFDSNLL